MTEEIQMNKTLEKTFLVSKNIHKLKQDILQTCIFNDDSLGHGTESCILT